MQPCGLPGKFRGTEREVLRKTSQCDRASVSLPVHSHQSRSHPPAVGAPARAGKGGIMHRALNSSISRWQLCSGSGAGTVAMCHTEQTTTPTLPCPETGKALAAFCQARVERQAGLLDKKRRNTNNSNASQPGRSRARPSGHVWRRARADMATGKGGGTHSSQMGMRRLV